MARTKLTKEQEEEIITLAQARTAGVKIASMIGCSTRTVGRVLTSRGMGSSRSFSLDEANKVRKLMAKYNMLTTKALEQVLKDHASGQTNLFSASVIDKVIVAETPPVQEGTKFAVSVFVGKEHAHVQVSYMVGDMVYLVYSNTHQAEESVSGFHLKMYQPELNLENVQQFLNNTPPDKLAALFYTSGLIKIAEMHNGSVTNATLRHQQAAAKGKVHYGHQPSYYKQG